jgi:hypothetical protein
LLEFLENKVVIIDIFIKNIGAGGTPAIPNIESKDSTFKEFILVIACKEFK